MKISQMREIAQNRENLVGFLHSSEIKDIYDLVAVDVSQMSFDDICRTIFAQLGAKIIKKKQATAVFEILMTANKLIKTEKFRFDSATNSIYGYSEFHNCYMFLKRGNSRDVAKLEMSSANMHSKTFKFIHKNTPGVCSRCICCTPTKLKP